MNKTIATRVRFSKLKDALMYALKISKSITKYSLVGVISLGEL